MNSIIVSTFEGGYQPATALTGLAAIRNAGYCVDFLDTYVGGYSINDLKDRDLVILPVPLFDSLNCALQLIRELKSTSSKCSIVLYGQYATINAQLLATSYADHVVVGEWEAPLVQLISDLSKGSIPTLNVINKNDTQLFQLKHGKELGNSVACPDRTSAPHISKYPQQHLDRLLGAEKIVGGIEISRGCHHRCTYCSVFSAYDGKVYLADTTSLIQDVDQLVEMGAEHLTFIDAEFFNAARRSIETLEYLHSRHPNITFDFTTRVDHILKNKEDLSRLRSLGVVMITSALEFPKQEVLDQINKEVSVEDLFNAVGFVRGSGILLNPTFIMFNPWVGIDDIARFYDFVEETGLENLIEPIQYETRLHLYKGSPLLRNETIKKLKLTEQEFHVDWDHSDPKMDELYYDSVTPSEDGVFKRCCLKC